MTGLAFDAADVVLATAAWSRLAEPGDPVAGAVVPAIGAPAALDWLVRCAREARGGTPDPAAVLRALRAAGMPSAAPAGCGGPAEGRAEGGEPAAPVLSAPAARRVALCVERWSLRLTGLDPRRELSVLHRLGGRLLTPAHASWPARLADLGAQAPLCLWVRGDPRVLAAPDAVALVGARACTEYGRSVASDLAAGLADHGLVVVSGGAFGIDAAAHRGALAAGGPTVAVLAGGVDRAYPRGNEDLFATILASGAVVSEVPPGTAPTRSRFLLRNRLIAAGSGVTVVVEAAARSGALNTAGHAEALLRPVGAVPGAVTSAASVGCHRLIREGRAVCVTDADDVAELVRPVGDGLSRGPAGVEAGDAGSGAGPVGGGPAGGRPGPRSGARDGAPGEWAGGSGGAVVAGPERRLSERERLVLDALPMRAVSSVGSTARAAGLTQGETLSALGMLELMGLVEPGGAGRWRRAAASGGAVRGLQWG